MYVDGFVIPLPKKNATAYQKMASAAGKVWMDHGALQYFECVGDDLDVKMGQPFPKELRLKKGETVVFAWILYRSRAHRDQVNKRVMKDPRMNEMDQTMPFDVQRMCYGGFKPIVELQAGAARPAKRAPRRAARANGHAEASAEQPL
jgi:uncharacterized protein YbaA (DUF1428 family)